MAKRTDNATTRAIAAGVAEALAQQGEEDKQPSEELDQDVIRALVELEGADDVRWQIHRLNQPNAGYCGELSTAELSLERIASMYGPGHYRVKGIRNDGTYFKSARIQISSPLNTGDETKKIEELLKATKSGDMMPLLIAMMNSNTSIVTAALNGNRRNDNTFPWQAVLLATPAVLEALRAFFKREDPDDKAIDRLLKQVSVLEKLRGDDGKGSNWTDVIRDALSTLPAMVGRSANAAPQPVAAVAVSGTHPVLPARISGNSDDHNGDTPTIPEPPEAVAPTPENATMIWLQKKLLEAVTWAQQNYDPALRADMLVEEWPAFIPEMTLLAMLKRDDWFEQLCAFEPACAAYNGWFSQLRDELIKILSNEGNGDE